MTELNTKIGGQAVNESCTELLMDELACVTGGQALASAAVGSGPDLGGETFAWGNRGHFGGHFGGH